jgi:hypothetical protein
MSSETQTYILFHHHLQRIRDKRACTVRQLAATLLKVCVLYLTACRAPAAFVVIESLGTP